MHTRDKYIKSTTPIKCKRHDNATLPCSL